jgi:eukaryotic-like serine/threonine-protein kinase
LISIAKVDSADSTDSRVLARAENGSLSSFSATLGSFTRDNPRVIAALDVYLEELRAGHPLSKEEFLARHADIADELGKCLSALEFIQGAAAQLGGPDVFATADPTNAIPRRAQLGDYRIIREVGRGGMGVVYEAEQVSLGRRVALKVLPFAAAIDPRHRQRFQIEAQAAAQLHHPHIVPIFSVGCEHGIHYYVMQFVDGRSLAAVLDELRHDDHGPIGFGQPATTITLERTDERPPSAPQQGDASLVPVAAPDAAVADADWNTPTSPVAVPTQTTHVPRASGAAVLTPTPIGSTNQDRAFCRNVARLGAQAADALDHAHDLGILHRDIKPANLLIDPDGALWITDFGLARFASDLSLTRTGEVVGTLRYMSPEQAMARRGVVDQRTDIYSLGVTLYELLTLRPAFDGRDHQELLRQIALDEPISPRRLNPAVPADLETIVLKAMAKDPSCRYATGQELAADLTRFMEDKPILARRPGALERTARWARRHFELVVTAAAIFVLASTISAALVWRQAHKTQMQAHETELANQRRVTVVVETYPDLHEVGTAAIAQAGAKLSAAAGKSATGDEAARTFERWERFFKQAIELPPDDRDSRTVIARAHSRLAFARWMMSVAKATKTGLESQSLAEALAEYRRSADLLEELLHESPGDPKIRRYLAESLGLGNMACCLRMAVRTPDAESLYRRSIQIRRELLRGTSSTGSGDTSASASGELEDLLYLVSTVHVMAGMLEGKGLMAEADGMRRQLTDDVSVVAAQMSGPKFRERRQSWAIRLVKGELPIFDPSRQRDVMFNQRLALIIDPDNSVALNNLAWSLASVPGDPWYNPSEALALARKAVALEPNEWTYLNTLGVAAFRAGDWNTAANTFQEAVTFTGGGSYNLYFLAMTYWHQGNKKDARAMYNRAVAWTDTHKPNDPELRKFRAEAAALLGEPCTAPGSVRGRGVATR